MIPSDDNFDDTFDDELKADFDLGTEPSQTYAMVLPDEEEKDNFFLGLTDEEDALRQAIIKIINTERYEYEIYSWNYGIELADLFGSPMPYAMSEVKERITDAITADDRFESVEDFTVTRIRKNVLYITFTVVTTEGEEIQGMEMEVGI